MSTLENCYDIILHNQDYTIGKIIEYILYEKFYNGQKVLTYIGFRKSHPHDDYSIIRIAFKKSTTTEIVKKLYKDVCNNMYCLFMKSFKSQLK